MDRRNDNPPSIDRDRFLSRSNAALHRIERNSLMILGGGALTGFLFSRSIGLSLLIGGLMGMLHFRSLHRMFQRRILDPASKHKSQFIYGLKLFLMIGVFFWAIQWKEIRSLAVIAGFFLMAASVLLESKRS
ncbi:MAG: ATP synthase subunit I [Nitrospiria bacterium]